MDRVISGCSGVGDLVFSLNYRNQIFQMAAHKTRYSAVAFII